ncbi:MAG TPA: ABC transporter substrate-binding protein [Acidimicrobiales bacterium]|nr:ABC transporter substrate-binding protein [Acidimicrobiales bacterium]
MGSVPTRRPRASRRLLWTLVAAGLIAAGCGGGDDDEAGSDGETTGATSDISEQGEPVAGGSITVGLEAETNNWLPGTGQFSNAGTSVAFAIYDPLMRRDANGEMQPYLAESIEPNADLTEWTLKLRPDITFHDDTPLNAQALKTIFDDYLKADGAVTAANLAEVEMVIVDDLTVTYQLSEPNSAFADELGLAIGWPFSPTAAAAAGDDAGSRPVGTGPFVFDSWERDNRLIVKKNPNYWQEGLPYLDEIVFRPIPDEDTRISSLETGDIDVLQTLRQSSGVRVRDLEGVDSYEQLGNITGVNIFNTTVPPLDDVRVREALARAVDQAQIIEIQGGTGVVPPSTQVFSEDDPYYSEAVADAWATYDPEAATELLDEYINDPARSDGKAAGEPVTFRYDCPPDPSLVDMAQLYQSFWGEIGAEVELRQVEQATHIDEAISGDYEAKCFRAGLDRDPLPTLEQAFSSTSGLNFTRFTDPAIDENLDALGTSTDIDERKALVEEISTIVNDGFPMTYHGSTLSVLGTQETVKGLAAWTFPEGAEGSGTSGATTMWGFVWTTG